MRSRLLFDNLKNMLDAQARKDKIEFEQEKSSLIANLQILKYNNFVDDCETFQHNVRCLNGITDMK